MKSINELRDKVKGTPYQEVFNAIFDDLALVRNAFRAELAAWAETMAADAKRQAAIVENAKDDIAEKITNDENARRKERLAR